MPEKKATDTIDTDRVTSLHQLFQERLKRSPDHVAYRYFDNDDQQWLNSTWDEMAEDIAAWQVAMIRENLEPGDTVALMLRNCREWVMCDQAALGLGLAVVPLYTEDRADNVTYILNDANVQLFVIEGKDQWEKLYEALKYVTGLKRIISLESLTGLPHDPRLRWIRDWIPEGSFALEPATVKADALATIVYTSGTTGRPKGVMLSHRNVLWNVKAALSSVTIYPSDLFISFLPLSHTLERTIGYYLPMGAGAQVAYARSVADLPQDMKVVKPTILVSVPRIFERVYNKIHEKLQTKSAIASHLFHDAVEVGYSKFLYKQKRGSWRMSFLFLPLLRGLVARKILAGFGGRLRLSITGGAALSPTVARTFIGLGLNLLQGYGLTEHSPVVSVNRLNNNDPDGVGLPLPGVEIQTTDQGELLVRSPSVMIGYLNNREATQDLIDEEGWLSTGDKVEIRNKRIYITGRLKEIIVLSNGEKVPPTDMEMAIQQDSLFEQVIVIGEQRPFLTALVVLNQTIWKQIVGAKHPGDTLPEKDLQDTILLQRIAQQLKQFPGHAQVHQVGVADQAWTIDNALLTPTLKPRRKQISAKYALQIESLYHGH